MTTFYQTQQLLFKSVHTSVVVEHRIPNRDPGFDPHRRHVVVSLSKTHLLTTVLVKPRNG